MTRSVLMILLILSAFTAQAQDFALQAIQEVLVCPMEKGEAANWSVTGLKSWKIDVIETGPEVIIKETAVDPKTLKPFKAANRSAFLIKADSGKGGEVVSLALKKGAKIPGITKQISFWVRGGGDAVRKLSIIVEDINGIQFKLPAAFNPTDDGSFRPLTVSVPYYVLQYGFYTGYADGLVFWGVEMVLEERTKALEIGIDAVTAVTDLYYELASEDGEMKNDW